MTSSSGNKVANQYIITDDRVTDYGDIEEVRSFQSYDSIIVHDTGLQIFLDETYWNYSVTTAKYRNQFLGEKKAETVKKIESGEYKLVNLN